jgi:pyruvate,orthophosphate dikinase
MHFVGRAMADEALTSELVGGKAANLVRLQRLGLDVPPALALPTHWCRAYMADGALPDDFPARLAAALGHLEQATGCRLGGRRPLLVSVRSSPPHSMPGMLRTVLNLGLTEDGVHALVQRTGNPWLAWDVYRRFIRSFAETAPASVVGPLDRASSDHLVRAGAESLQDLDPLALRDLARAQADLFQEMTGRPIPVDPLQQIIVAIESVLQSWASPWARDYRRLNGLDDSTGTGVLIQAMVFGNSGPHSGSGVGFTRNPATGDRELFVDFLVNAQGEDVVAGRLPVAERQRLPEVLPKVWTQLQAATSVLEREFRDMQDFEFTVDQGRLYFLQTRPGKRTPWAALRIATDLVGERLLDPAGALERLAAYDLGAIGRVYVQPRDCDMLLAHATPASIGVATGAIVFDAERARAIGNDRPVVLVRAELTTDDVAGLAAAQGVLTTYGGRTSHAAVVARQLGKVCLVSCADLHVDAAARECSIGGRRLRDGAIVTLDGETGLVYEGRVPVVVERPEQALSLVAAWRALSRAEGVPCPSS